MKKINIAGTGGFLLCFAAIVFGIASNGGLHTIINFLHLPSLIITLGGSLFAVLATADSFSDFFYGLQGLFSAYRKNNSTELDIKKQILELSNISRKEGLLSLEENIEQSDNEFLKKGIRLVVDGSDPELVKDILNTELYYTEAQEKMRIHFWQDFGSYAPAWGMVGTLLGLINMMRSMGNDPTAIGAGMSLALITTLYGSVIANWICIPIARKLEKNWEQQSLQMELVIEGVLSIQAGDNPRVIEEKIHAILLKETEVLDAAA